MERITTEEGIRFLQDGMEKAAILEAIGEREVTVSLVGSFSGGLAYDLMDELSSLMIAGKGIVIDAAGADYFSSSVCEVFRRTELQLEEQQKTLKIVNLPQKLFEEFRKNGLYDILEIEVAK